jgi:acetoin utilization deacetylase AcuC-like enzyme
MASQTTDYPDTGVPGNRTKQQTICAGNREISQILQSIQKKRQNKQKLNMAIYIYDDKCKGHEQVTDGGLPHQESKLRVMQINGALNTTGLTNILVTGGSIGLKRSNILSVHNPDYVAYLESICGNNKPAVLDKPCSDLSITNSQSLEAMHAAAASVLGAVNLICSGCEVDTSAIKKQCRKEKIYPPVYRSTVPRRAFCNVRPPGHHAHKDHGAGFCFLNNVAIGARYALDKYPDKIKKVLIFDWDLHHGDGTQDIFGKRRNSNNSDNSNSKDDVFYISIHRGTDFYPHTGSLDDNQTFGNVLNLPLSAKVKHADYMEYFNDVVLPAAYGYSPDLIMISAGFDSHADDLYGELPLDYEDYSYMTRRLIDVAETCSDGRIVSVLEGGYSLHVLIRAVSAHVATMINHDGDI